MKNILGFKFEFNTVFFFIHRLLLEYIYLFLIHRLLNINFPKGQQYSNYYYYNYKFIIFFAYSFFLYTKKISI